MGDGVKMRQAIVGIYPLGHIDVEVVLREGSGAEYWSRPDKGHIPTIKIGADQRQWGCIVECAMHEAMEFELTERMHRFIPCADLGRDNGVYSFHFSHAEFSDACNRVGFFLAACLPDLATAWKKWKKTE